MKKLLAFSILFLGLALLNGATINGLVVGVSDGDTIKVLDASKTQHRIRLGKIDAPESHQAFGNISKQHLSKLIFQKNVRVEWEEKDQYGRIVGVVFLGKENINLAMVKAGLAWHYVYYAKNDKEYADAQAEAKKNKLGLWQDKAPIPPWEYRKAMKQSRKNKK